MATRSIIAAQFSPEFGSGIVSTYCHYDGYLEGVGATLATEYANENDAFMVADAGYLSEVPHLSNWEIAEHANKEAPAYFNTEAELLIAAVDSGAEYVYLWKEGEWHWMKIGFSAGFHPVEKA